MEFFPPRCWLFARRVAKLMIKTKFIATRSDIYKFRLVSLQPILFRSFVSVMFSSQKQRGVYRTRTHRKTVKERNKASQKSKTKTSL